MESKNIRLVLFTLFVSSAVLIRADHLHEIHVMTSNCGDCGMAAFFGQLSVKVSLTILFVIFSY